MSLVAYGSSDSEEDEENEVTTQYCSKSIPKKQRESVKITIPSLKEFNDDDPVLEKKPVMITKSESRSGLFSILPPPKHAVSAIDKKFIPHVFTKKKVNKPQPPPKSTIQKEAVSSTEDSLTEPNINSQSNFLDDTDALNEKGHTSTSGIDFFSLSTDNYVGLPQVSSSSGIFSVLPKPALISSAYAVSLSPETTESSSSVAVTQSDEAKEESKSYPQYNWDENAATETQAEEVEPETSFLKDDRFKKLRVKREMEDVNIIDVNAGDQLTDKDQWLIQSLTEEKVERPSKRRHDMPTHQQKRKHQITYLAFQAKERELDLKNQWALNSRTRRETQAKYGF